MGAPHSDAEMQEMQKEQSTIHDSHMHENNNKQANATTSIKINYKNANTNIKINHKN